MLIGAVKRLGLRMGNAVRFLGRYGIETASAEWRAAENTPQRHSGPAQPAVLADSDCRIFRAGGMEAAGSPGAAQRVQHGRKEEFVGAKGEGGGTVAQRHRRVPVFLAAGFPAGRPSTCAETVEKTFLTSVVSLRKSISITDLRGCRTTSTAAGRRGRFMSTASR